MKWILRFIIWWGLGASAFAAIQAGMNWDVRTTGADTNGGGFDSTVASPGTDFSQQNGAQQAYTDLVIGVTTTQLTSAAHAFGATAPGNVINITGGSGCTTGWYEVISVSGVTATMDRSVGTAASTCTGNLGGSLATYTKAMTLTVAGNVINVQAGTYTTTTATTLPTVQFVVRGYNATHGDGGTKPTLNMSTANNVNFWVLGSGTSLWVDNCALAFTGATNNPVTLLLANAGNPLLFITSSTLDGNSLNGSGNGRVAAVADGSGAYFQVYFDNVAVTNWWQHNTGNDGLIISTTNQVTVKNSYFGTIWEAVQNGQGNSNLPLVIIENCVFNLMQAATLSDVHDPGVPRSPAQWIIRNNAFYGNSAGASVAFQTLAPFTDTTTNSNPNFYIWENNIVFAMNRGLFINKNSGTGIAQNALVTRFNAYGSNGTDVSGATKSTTDITLTGNPWTNVATPDFSLNNTAGAGASLRSAGFPGVLTTGGTGFLDVGPLQHSGTAAATISGYTFQ